jgi:hypothetical protein
MFALAVLAWSVAAGDHWVLPIALFVASFLVQAHVGTTVACVVLLAVACVALAIDARRGRVAGIGALAATCAGVVLVLWIPPIVDQFQSGGGNLGEIWTFFTSEQDAGPSVAHSARIVADEFGVDPPWATGDDTIDFTNAGLDPPWTFPVALVLVAAAAFVSARRRDRDAVTLAVVALALALAAWFSVARVVGVPYFYVLRWTRVTGAVAVLAVAWTAMRLMAGARPQVRWALGAVTSVAAAALVTATTASSFDADAPVALESQVVSRLDGPLLAEMDDAATPVLVRPGGGFASGLVTSGVLARLVDAGIDAGVEPEYEHVVGATYVLAPAEAGTELVVLGEGDDFEVWRRDDAYREVTSYDTLSASARTELTELRARTSVLEPTALAGWLVDHPRAAARLAELSAVAGRGGVFVRR